MKVVIQRSKESNVIRNKETGCINMHLVSFLYKYNIIIKY